MPNRFGEIEPVTDSFVSGNNQDRNPSPINRLVIPSRWLCPSPQTARLVALTLCLVSTTLLNPAQNNSVYDLTFNPDKFTEQTVTYNGKTMTVWAYEFTPCQLHFVVYDYVYE